MNTPFDPKTTPSVPYFIELRKQFGLTQTDLALDYGLTRMSIARTEQLNYPEPLPMVATCLSLSTGTPLNDLLKHYRNDVLDRRRYTSELLYKPIDTECNRYGDYVMTFKEWRISRAVRLNLPTSIIKFSSMICVHPDIITNYERKQSAKRNTSIPETLAVAFEVMGYPSSFLRTYIGGTS